MSDGQLAGAWRLGYQGFGSASAVRTRAGPETRGAPPRTQRAFYRVVKEACLCTYIYIFTPASYGVVWRERGENYHLYLDRTVFFFSRRNASPNSRINRGVQFCEASPGQHRGGKRRERSDQELPFFSLTLHRITTLTSASAAFTQTREFCFISLLLYFLFFFLFFGTRWI